MRKFLAIFILLALSCCGQGKFDRNSKKAKEHDVKRIRDKSDLIISENFISLQDSVAHTPGAFDSDYAWYLKLLFPDTEAVKIKIQIKSSEYFDMSKYQDYSDTIWRNLEEKNKKGLWCIKKNEFSFIHSRTEQSEPFTLDFDTTNNILYMKLQHL